MIQEVYESSLPYGYDSFTVIAGPKGGGKTTAVHQMLNGKSGVLFVDVTEADSGKTILDKLLDTTREPVEGVKPGIGVLSPFFLAAAETADGRRITVVLEVERGTDSDAVLYMVKSSAKKLACFANVIVVLSEANAALMFGEDRRQSFIWMDGMTNDEATEYAQKVFPAAPGHDLNLYFDKVGIIPYIPFESPHANHTPHNAHLTSVSCALDFSALQVSTLPLEIRVFAEALNKKVPAGDYIEAALCAAERDLARFTHQPILKALKSSPDGVSTAKFQGVKHEGVHLAEPKEVAVAMKKSNAIVYHIPSGEYRLTSRAHRTALLERYKPRTIWNFLRSIFGRV